MIPVPNIDTKYLFFMPSSNNYSHLFTLETSNSQIYLWL